MKPKPCPFCKKSRLRVTQRPEACFVDCIVCGCVGPKAATMELAVDIWNGWSGRNSEPVPFSLSNK